MSNRIKLKGPTIESRAQLDNILHHIRRLTIERNQVQLDRDAAVAALDDRTGPVLTELGQSIERHVESVRCWAESNPDEFGKLKSLDTTHAVIGWRTGNLSLAKLAGWTWDRVVEKIKSLPAMSSYLRVKEDVAKDLIIADREVLGPEGLRMIGVKIAQSESFFVEPKIEEADNRQTA
jgi:phage host-nuclease inhibitor protein Gam